MFAASASAEGWRGQEAKLLLSSIPVTLNQPPHSHHFTATSTCTHCHTGFYSLSFPQQKAWRLSETLAWLHFFCGCKVFLLFLFLSIFYCYFFSGYIRTMRIMKGKSSWWDMISRQISYLEVQPFIMARAHETCKRCCLILFVAKLRRLHFLLYKESCNRGRFNVCWKPQANLFFSLSLKFFPLTLHLSQLPGCSAVMQEHF